jgi:hypothetical protein
MTAVSLDILFAYAARPSQLKRLTKYMKEILNVPLDADFSAFDMSKVAVEEFGCEWVVPITFDSSNKHNIYSHKDIPCDFVICDPEKLVTGELLVYVKYNEDAGTYVGICDPYVVNFEMHNESLGTAIRNSKRRIRIVPGIVDGNITIAGMLCINVTNRPVEREVVVLGLDKKNRCVLVAPVK